jgi:hypothetical protein
MEGDMKRIAVLAAILGLGAATAAEAHQTSYPTEIEVKYVQTGGALRGSGFPLFVGGDVSSPRAACVPDRRVKVFGLTPAPRGFLVPVLIDTDRTSANGAWSGVDDFAGMFGVKARVTKRNIGASGHKHICQADVDEEIFL